MTLGEKEYFVDLLFYHTRLKRYIVIDLKIGEFQPEYLGKMEFYLKLADEQLKNPDDESSIGLILCKTKDGLVAEYALRDSKMPIGIAEYKISESLPENIKGELPSIEEIEQKLDEGLKTSVEKRLEILKLKLSELKTEEVKTTATYEILCRIIDRSIKPLFDRLLEKLEGFIPNFISHSKFWFVGDHTVQNKEEYEAFWKDEAILKKHKDLYFSYRLHGLKRGGIESFDTGIQLHFVMDLYWYGFKLINYDHHQPFLKKLYDQDLTNTDIETIVDTACEQLIDDIELRLKSLTRDV